MSGFNGNQLREIRIVRKMTLAQLAQALGMTKQAVSKYEHGQSIPATETIDKMLSILSIPFKYLCKDDPKYTKECSPLFFRALSSTTQNNIEYANIKSQWSYEILSAIETSQVRSFNIPNMDSHLSIAEKALALRKHWEMGSLPIRNLTQLLEGNGIYVFAVQDADLKTDAYSRVINGYPVIVLNKCKGTAVRWRFSLAHELGHLLLHRSLSETDFAFRGKELEDEANLFAENFLMPEDGFKKSIIATKLEHFIPLKKEWGVSIAAMLYHCNRIGIIDSRKTKSLQIQMSKMGWKKREPLDDELTFEQPTLLKSILNEQLRDHNSFAIFYDAVQLPLNEIESLCSLQEGFFSSYDFRETTEKALSDSPTYEQLSLF